MFRSLKSKFIVSFVFLELVFFVIIISISFTSLNKASQKLVNEKIDATSQLLVELIKIPLITFDLATIDDIVKNFSTIENSVGIQIKGEGDIEYSSYLKEGAIPKKLFINTIKKDENIILYQNKEYAFHSIDVIVGEKNIGHIDFVFDTSYRLKSIENDKKLIYIMVLIALFISFIISYVIGNNLGKSLSYLSEITKAIAHDKRVNISHESAHNYEMKTLFQSMDFMQKVIFERTEKLNKSIKLFDDNVIASSSNLQGKITYASKALCDISGYTYEELIGKPHSILRHTETSTKVFKELWSTISSGKTWSGKLKNNKKDGGYYWVDISVVPEFDSKHNMTGYASISHDITAEKIKEEFMANMSHELRTPLNAIIGFGTILKKKLTGKEELSLLEHINSSSKSLLALINDILDLSKIKDSKFTIEPYVFNAYDEISDSCQDIEGLLSNKNITLDKNIDESLKVRLHGDWHRINQIILNIISNALKFTDENGLITYEACYQDNRLILIISDNGIGMTKEVQNKVFEPFEQADGSTTRKYGGTGLGLSITQSLVEHMNGEIQLESTEGVGATFKIILPLQKSAEALKESDVLTKTKAQKKLTGHVLVAEDNKTNQILIKMLLDEFGVSCDIANDGQEAIQMYDPHKHSLILMDENMPRINGLNAMKALQEKYTSKCGPIIALTANTMAGDKENFLAMGMSGYIPKPIDIDLLYTVLEDFLLTTR